jgi:ComF family protein
VNKKLQIGVRWARIFETAINILYPAVCPLCSRVVTGTQGRSRPCPECAKKLKYVGDAHCLKCGKPLKDRNAELCDDCAESRHYYDQGAAVFEYSDGIRESIFRYKYGGCRNFADWYGEEMYRQCRTQMEMWKPQAVIPVPLYVKKRKVRGYNQAELIADRLGELSGIKVDAGILVRNRATVPQKTLNDSQRAENIKKAFTITKNNIKYKRVLLIDDIYTTGSTVDECAKVLKAAGVERVYCASLCVGGGV